MTLQHSTRKGYPLQINHLNIFHCQHTKPKMDRKKNPEKFVIKKVKKPETYKKWRIKASKKWLLVDVGK